MPNPIDLDFSDHAPNKLNEWLATQSLAIACPMANEADTALEFVRQMLDQAKPFKSVIFNAVLDNVSHDNTLELLRDYAQHEPRLKVVWAPENRNVVDAYVKGYREAISTGFEWILEIDAGFSHRPDELPKFFPYMYQGYESIFGSRFCAGGEVVDKSLFRLMLSKGGTLLSRFFLGAKLTDMTSGYQMFSARSLQRILYLGIHSNGPFFQTEIKVKCQKLKIAEVPITYCSPSRKISLAEIYDALSCFLWLANQVRKGKILS